MHAELESFAKRFLSESFMLFISENNDSYICWEATDAITEPSDRVYICLPDFKLPPPIENPADCEVRAVIRFLCAQGFKSVDIHHQISEVYGENIMSDGMG
ncbi:hypothetical protein TNCV_3342791 [Trichonephila clavipes]|nr:hypothetical protein TNCV_3342791 [Trichonephila clavipes]